MSKLERTPAVPYDQPKEKDSSGLSPIEATSSLSEKEDYDSEKISQTHDFLHDEDVTLVRGEPVIVSGKDVSRFAVDLRDDGDPALTLRSMVLGTVFAGQLSLMSKRAALYHSPSGLAAALGQVYIIPLLIYLVSSTPHRYICSNRFKSLSRQSSCS